MDLVQLFSELNQKHFDGLLPTCDLHWNSRLRVVAGRFSPRKRLPNDFRFGLKPALIEIAGYLRQKPDGPKLIEDTLGHEMIHYWLWIRGRPYGHTAEFLKKMRAMGVNRYNPCPERRAFKYLYGCPHCKRTYPSRKHVKALACKSCCDKHNRGRFDARFRLVFISNQGGGPS